LDLHRSQASATPVLDVGAVLVMTIKLPEKCGEQQVAKQVDESLAILQAVGAFISNQSFMSSSSPPHQHI
jgi:hypothetical protein